MKPNLFFMQYPKLKIGFSTQNFLKALPLNIEGIVEITDFAHEEGYQFVEVRDQFVDLTVSDCKALAKYAAMKDLEMIYVFNKNPLDSEFLEFFQKALNNVSVLTGPGILRALVSGSEFDIDTNKKGWTSEEFTKLCSMTERCVQFCKTKSIDFVYENNNEAFFGIETNYFGLADLLLEASGIGLQFDIANPFRKSSRIQPEPKRVLEFLPKLGNKWVETHLKSVQEGDVQPILTENPIAIEDIIKLMGKQDVRYVALELLAVEEKQQCFTNHQISTKFLQDKGILNIAT